MIWCALRMIHGHTCRRPVNGRYIDNQEIPRPGFDIQRVHGIGNFLDNIGQVFRSTAIINPEEYSCAMGSEKLGDEIGRAHV